MPSLSSPDRPDLVIASNRGPVSFELAPDGSLRTRRAGGGLASTLGVVAAGTGAHWVGAAMTEADRRAAESGSRQVEGFAFRALDIEAGVYAQAYDVVSNLTLWFLHHHLFDLPRRPRFDHRWREAWDGFRAYNAAFAKAVAEEAPDRAVVLVQDYHLSLVPEMLAGLRHDLRVVHFHHTAFAEVSWLRVLPDPVARELLQGLAGAHACGFHSPRWEASFRAGAQAFGVEPPTTFVSPLAPAPGDLEGTAASDACAAAGAELDRATAGRRLIVRVDRIEPSKNIVRGFLAYETLLARRKDLRGQVVFAAFVYPSRESLAEYLAYHDEVRTVAERINARWASADWTPILLHDTDNFARSVAALTRYDVLLVNPVRDGMNLVAKEGALVNRNHGLVVLSREAGAWDELDGAAIGINPFDIEETADALAQGLDLGDEERRARSAELRRRASARDATHWLADQIAAAG